MSFLIEDLEAYYLKLDVESFIGQYFQCPHSSNTQYLLCDLCPKIQTLGARLDKFHPDTSEQLFNLFTRYNNRLYIHVLLNVNSLISSESVKMTPWIWA